jgi:hypothetical protein
LAACFPYPFKEKEGCWLDPFEFYNP